MKDKTLINDSRLTPTMQRTRSGRRQNFRELDQQDIITLEHADKGMYAEFIEGEWYWVTGCEECKGEPRDYWKSYVECDKHDVCSCCGISRKDINGAVHGGKYGWTCKPCKEAEKLEIKRQAFETLNGEEPDTTYTSSIICPHCGSEVNGEGITESANMDCPVCEGEFHVDVCWTPDYSTKVIGDRLTE